MAYSNHRWEENDRACEIPQRFCYLDRLWIFLAVVMIIVNEWSTTAGYVRTVLFDPIEVIGLNIAPIEVIIFIAVILILPKIMNSVLIKGVLGHPAITALVIFAFGTGMVKGYLRLGAIEGLAEIKSLFLLGVFVYLSRRVIARGVFRRVVPLLCCACLLHSAFEIFRYLVNPIVDADLGEKTRVNVIPFLLLPVFVAATMNRNERFRFIYPVCIVFVIVDIYLSQSRASLVEALSGVLLTLAFCKLKQTRPQVQLGRFIPAAGLIVLVLLLVGGIALSGTEFVRSFAFWQDQADQAHNASNLGHYFDILRAIQMIGESPVSGMGFGGNLPILGSATFDVIHNEFLHFWVFFGIGGAILWLYMFLVLPVQFIRKLDRARGIGHEIEYQHYLIFSMIGCSLAHFIALPPFHLFVPEIWFIGLYLASLTSVAATAGEKLYMNVKSGEPAILPLESEAYR